MAADVLIGAVLILIPAGTVYMAVILFLTAQYQSIHASDLRMNDGEVARDEFTRLLSEAKESLIIYDDGDRVADSIYDSPEVIAKFQEKLITNPEFRIYCLFNCDEPELMFRKEFGNGGPQVKIRVRDSVPRYNETSVQTHYKIIDGGVQAYLSWHYPGSSERIFKTVDCSGVVRFLRPRVIKNVLGQYMAHFKREFGSVEVSV